jgi:NAD(P)-dependent dehydrogenase (short-subunit alcohol dehydrogenase family)
VPTILINNAGIVNGKPLLDLSASEVQRNFNVNLLSHFHTIRTFLPGMLASETGGTIVTISSVLGKLGASNLADYTAAKAGLIAMHNSLRAELGSSSASEGAEYIRTILVTPGQLSTNLFAGVKTPSSFFGPVVEPVELAREIVRMIDSGESGQISMPFYARWIEWMHVLPASMQKMVRKMSGVDRAMETVGKKVK